MSLSSISKPLRTAVLERDGNRCQYCGVLQAGQVSVFHVDHVVPRSKSGLTVIENLVLQCPHCSLHKSNKIEAIDPKSGEVTGIFHPLAHKWTEHFELTADGEIVGKSSLGRATVDALSMNDAWPRSARALQVALGWIGI